MRFLIVLVVGCAAAQTADSARTFEVASIRPGLDMSKPDGGHTAVTPDSVSMIDVTLLACAQWAYAVGDDRVLGPAWLGSARYDIHAKAAGPTPVPELRLMMQALLADRFRMVLHHEARERPVLVMHVSANAQKLTPTADTRTGTLKVVGDNLMFEHFTPAELADRLSVMLGRPVLDRTGIGGAFDVMVPVAGGVAELKAAAEHSDLANEGRDPSPYVAALRKVGLKLEAVKLPVDVIVIDRAERVPTNN